MQHFKENTNPLVLEIPQEFSDGCHWTEISANVISHNDDELVVVIFLSIIDERRKSEIETKERLEKINEQLRKNLISEERYRQAMTSGASTVYYVNLLPTALWKRYMRLFVG